MRVMIIVVSELMLIRFVKIVVFDVRIESGDVRECLISHSCAFLIENLRIEVS